METIAERRKENLMRLVKQQGGLSAFIKKTGMSEGAIDQIMKGTLLPPKLDGTRSPRALGNTAARKIEERLGLPVGWLDTANQLAAVPQSDDLLEALQVVCSTIAKMDKDTRLSVVPSFTRLANEPFEDGTIARHLHKLLSQSVTTAKKRQDEAPAIMSETTQKLGGLRVGKSTGLQSET